MSNCKKCNAEITSRFCPNCGYDNGDKNICPVCGSEMNSRFCGQCGYDSQKGHNGVNKQGFKAFFKKHTKPIIAISSSLLAVVLITTLCIVYFSNIFRIAKVSKIEIGMSEAQVEKILGEPTYEDEGTWYYYQRKVAKKVEKAEKIINDLEFSEDESDWEEAEKKYDEIYAKIEEMTFKSISVDFDSDGKVREVFLNKKTKYEAELSSYEKAVRKAKLGVKSLSGDMITIDGETDFKLADDLGRITYSVKYKDRSYYLCTINAYNLDVTKENKKYLVSWEDDLGKYSVKKDVNLIREYEIAEGVLVSYKSSNESFEIPSSVVKIGDGVFENNTSLKNLTIPSSVKEIGTNAFVGCSSLTFTEFSNALYLGNESNPHLVLVKAKSTDITECEINGATKIICDKAFQNCTKLIAIDVPSSTICIGDYAFAGCTSLTNLKIPDSIISMGEAVLEGIGTFYYNGLKLSPTDNGLSVVGYNGKGGSIVIPEELNGYKIVSIGARAFNGNKDITGITIPNSITSIGTNAFEMCTNLTSVNYLGYIDGWCNIEFVNLSSNPLYYAKNLYLKGELITNLVIPNTVKEIKTYVFRGGNFSSVTIPDSVTFIENSAFSGCASLTSISIPDSVTSIGQNVFEGCSSLVYNEYDNAYYLGNEENPYVVLIKAKDTNITSCVINENTKLLFKGALYGCSSLTSVTIPDSVTSIESFAFEGCSSLTSITIPDSVTSIGDYAFRNCSSLTSITIPNSVTSIGGYAFDHCSSLTSITIPDSVTSIGSYAFLGCYSLTSVNYLGNIEDWCNISFDGSSANPLYYAKNLYLNGELVTNLVIPDTVTKIKDYAFYDCDSLTSITIPNSVTSIGGYAFYGCSSLTSITIPDSVTSIGDDAFYNCDSLTSVTIGDSVTSIGSYAFYNCPKLVEVYNLSSLNITAGSSSNGYAGYYAKVVHTSLEDTSILETVDDYIFMTWVTWEDNYYLVGYIGNETELTLPESYNGNNYEIYKYAFYERDDITKVTIPDSVTSIGSSAFYGCTSLTNITIPDSVTSIGNYVFDSCSSLTSVTIPDSVTSIGSSAFEDCSSLTSVTIPDSVTSIGWRAFSGCSSLTSITIPDSVTSIKGYAFEGCTSLTNITIPDSVTSIGSDAFSSCSSLTNITVDVNNTNYKSIDGNLYSKDGKTLVTYAIGKTDKTFIIPNSVTSIGDSAFYGCSSLTSITIPDSVTSIGGYAFEGCTSLTNITIPDSVTSIGDWAFVNCSSLTVYCEATSKPSGWESRWNYSNRPVYWYSEEEPTTDGNYWHYVDGVVTIWE